jgi:hypothetical protein
MSSLTRPTFVGQNEKSKRLKGKRKKLLGRPHKAEPSIIVAINGVHVEAKSRMELAGIVSPATAANNTVGATINTLITHVDNMVTDEIRKA